ncbi:dethiobiotin synthase [Bradyrhizobium sp. CCBAU 21360]|uniref:dethiobiotin synthase n=1 Tax=Bradyrhizobium sp. CCBAU 21360 TaxID=1325081 RepID=UPI002304EFF2|nr:dethiobiotin synthase [Bradyrhizobium sp. CCBAU 21360]MDA9448326.1 dethiobiotin synthetase [Bradyrhizobium sp. CCBAU 21360]
MTCQIVVTGTDTDVGKTVFSAALTNALGALYWKPVQAGLKSETDSKIVTRLSGLSKDRIVPERWSLGTPASPHRAAEIDNVQIDPEALHVPDTGGRPLVIEAAGGLMVPLNRRTLYIDVIARWGLPIVLCTRTTLGTINHSLLSLEALRRRRIDVLGIAFIGDEQPDSEGIICDIGRARRLGRLPHLSPLTRQTLQAAFARSFDRDDFML